MDWLIHLVHNDHGELALAASLFIALSNFPAVLWARACALWRSSLSRLDFVWESYRIARCHHTGAREYVTHVYHDEIGAWALECPRCGVYWDQTSGPLPGRMSRMAALRYALPALWWEGTPSVPASEDNTPF